MANIRQLIRSDIKTALTGLATTGSNVYASRVYPLDAGKLPGLVLYTDEETTEYITVGLPRTQRRTLTIKIEAYVKGTSGSDDALDTICAEVEAALYNDVTRNGYAHDTQVVSFDARFAGDGDQPVATGVISVEVVYTTAEGAPTN